MVSAIAAIALVASGILVGLAPRNGTSPDGITADPSFVTSATTARHPFGPTVPKPVHLPKFTVVDKYLTHAVEKSRGTRGVKAVFLADKAALADPTFKTISSTLVNRGNGLYSGRLTKSSLAAIQDVPGLKVSADVPIADSVPTKGAGSIADFLQDDDTTVQQTDPTLAATRTQLGLQGDGQVIAVVDSGIDSNAVGLGNGKVIHCEDFSGDATNGCPSGGSIDPFGHGTHVASIAAGAVNTVEPGISGVAPNAKLVDVRVLNSSNSGTSTSLDTGLNWILTYHATYGITVVNVSVDEDTLADQSGTDTTSVLVNRLVAAGLFVSVSAGNDGDGPSTIHAPGTAMYAATVGAANVSQYGDSLAYFSSQGPVAGRSGVDLLAPGESIRAAASTSLNVGHTLVFSGTSMAAPYVAGLAALLLEKKPADKPSGTPCNLGSSGCSVGVMNVTNGIETDMSTSQWFGSSMSTLSGAGLVNATNSLKAVATPAAPSLAVSLDSGSDNMVQLPAHSSAITVTLVTSTAVVGTANDDDKLNFTLVDAGGATSGVLEPCSLTIENGTSCQASVFTAAQRVWQLTVLADSSPSTLELRSPVATGAQLVAPLVSAPITFVNGISATDAQMDSTGAATVTLTRTVASSDTTITIDPSNGLTAPPSVTLGGSIGSTATIPVGIQDGFTPASPNTGGRLALSNSVGLVANVSVRYPVSDNLSGQITVGGTQLYTGELTDGGLSLGSDGTILGTSSQTELANYPATQDGYYPGPFVVPAGSNRASRIALSQSTPTAIDYRGASGDGSVVMLGEYGAGSGIVPIDTDNRYQDFVHNVATGVNTAVGTTALSPMYEVKLSHDGTDIAFVAHDSASNTEDLYLQNGPSYGTLTKVATFPSGTQVTPVSVNDTTIVATVPDADYYLDLHAYTVADGSDVVIGQYVTNGGQVVSEDGSSIAFMNTSGHAIYCYTVGVGASTAYQYIDDPFSLNAVGDGCSYIVASFEVTGSYPRGSQGVILKRVSSDGTATTLAESLPNNNSFDWITDDTGTQFATSTISQEDASDTNGLADIYRGTFGSTALASNAAPTITGSLASGSTLSVGSTGSWNLAPDSYTYQWYSGGTAISGATGATYATTSVDVNASITVAVTAIKQHLGKATAFSAPFGPITGLTMKGTAPKIYLPTGTTSASVGVQLQASFGGIGSWGPGDFSIAWQWNRDGVAISGANDLYYTITSADIGTTLTVTAEGEKQGYTNLYLTSAGLVVPQPFASSPAPTIDGAADLGKVLTADTGTWDPAPTKFTYVWKRNGKAISKATSSTYKLTSSDVGTLITVFVTATKTGYSTVSQTSAGVRINKPFTAAPTPTISGTLAVGRTLTATAGKWKPGSVALSFVWKRNGVAIDDATSSTYLLTSDDAGMKITVSVTGAESGYTSLTKSSSSKTIQKLLTATPTPTISGNITKGSKLVVAAGTWTPAPVKLTYQWYRNGAAIKGATKTSYTLGTKDVGATMTVKVTGSKSGYTTVAEVSAGFPSP